MVLDAESPARKVPTERQVSDLRIPLRRRSAALGLIGAATLVAALFPALSPTTSLASSHREAPLLLNDPLVDTTFQDGQWHCALSQYFVEIAQVEAGT